jgi:hypothetical protein
MPRFVLLYHRCPRDYVRPSHWDLMLESGDMLRTWALAQLPQEWRAAHTRTSNEDCECSPLAAGNEVEATQLADHRRAFLDFEGDLSGQRGRVMRVAAGTYRVQGEAPDWITCELEGNPVVGAFRLRRENDRTDRWTLMCGVSNCTAY